jgi:hypothetical protein
VGVTIGETRGNIGFGGTGVGVTVGRAGVDVGVGSSTNTLSENTRTFGFPASIQLHMSNYA